MQSIYLIFSISKPLYGVNTSIFILSTFHYFVFSVSDKYHIVEIFFFIQSKIFFREFPGSPVVRTWHFYCWGPGSIAGWGTKILQAARHGQKKKNLF